MAAKSTWQDITSGGGVAQSVAQFLAMQRSNALFCTLEKVIPQQVKLIETKTTQMGAMKATLVVLGY